MKCKYCNGTGEVEIVGDSVTDVFDKCGGTGFCEMRMGDNCTLGSPCPHQKPMTNEEWLKSCNTEQLAEVLWERINGAFNSGYACCNLKQDKDYVGRYKRFKEWLKQPHTDKE
jgi:hypothetical protein